MAGMSPATWPPLVKRPPPFTLPHESLTARPQHPPPERSLTHGLISDTRPKLTESPAPDPRAGATVLPHIRAAARVAPVFAEAPFYLSALPERRPAEVAGRNRRP